MVKSIQTGRTEYRRPDPEEGRAGLATRQRKGKAIYTVMGKKKALAFAAAALVLMAVLCVLGRIGMVRVVGSAQERKLPIYSVNRPDKVVALGINCAWDENDIPQILQVLEEKQVKATFFIVGEWAEQYPESVREIHMAGHEIGNHSYSHPDMTTLSSDKIAEDILRAETLLESLTGVKPNLFRPPSGAYNNRVVETAQGLGYQVVQWDCDSRDWKRLEVKQILSNILSKVQNGSITLLHSGAPNTKEALPLLIDQLKSQGYAFMTVGEMIYPEPYTLDHTGRQNRES